MKIENHIFKESQIYNSPNFNERPDESDIRLIIIHCISLPPDQYGGDFVKDFFLNNLDTTKHEYFNEIKDLKVSPHIFIKRNGEVLQFVPFNKRAWHAGVSCYKGIEDCNDYSIGIELEGNEKDLYTDNQYEVLIYTTNEILKKYPKIKPKNIVGHSEVAPNRKTDPGANFDWKRYLKGI